MNGTRKRLLVRAVAVLGLAFGVVGLFAPNVLVTLYELEGSTGVEAAGRFFGAAEIGLGLLAWRLADIPESWDAFFGTTVIGQIALIVAAYLAIASEAAGVLMWQALVLSVIVAALCLLARRTPA